MRQFHEKLENNKIPKILVVSESGAPLRWTSYERYAYYHAKGYILWRLGKQEYTLRGGINAKTQQQSTLIMESIIAVRNDSGKHKRMSKPVLSNAALFNRDNNTCAYCGNIFPRSKLTRDHIVPLSLGGADSFQNTVTACERCNQKKADRMLDEIDDMELLYHPYAPTHHENLILKNRHLSKEQLDYLIIGVSPHSRVYKDYYKKGNIK